MYFPYLRGKQFELIALRELSGVIAGDSQKIFPIIEPVKDSSTLKTTIRELKNKEVNFNIILNPSVGDLVGKSVDILNVISDVIDNYSNFQLGIIIKRETSVDEIKSIVELIEFDFAGYTLIHIDENNNISSIIDELETNKQVINNIIYTSKTSRRYYREFPVDSRVELDDFFNVLPRNSDYLPVLDSKFSEEYLFYKEDGYKGFSDFLTIGDNYTDSGFLPYAVAIHISYKDNLDEKIRIKHFVSDSNDDNSDVAGKFAEALYKLIDWCDNNNINSNAVNEFRNLHANHHFPGLGSIKKISVMHHIELVASLI